MSTHMTVKDRGDAITRAKSALDLLARNPATTLRQLGTARTHLNTAYNDSRPENVGHAVEAIERILSEVCE